MGTKILNKLVIFIYIKHFFCGSVGLGWAKLTQGEMFSNPSFKLKDCQVNIKFSFPNTDLMFPRAAKKDKRDRPLLRGKSQKFADFAIYHRNENLFQLIVAKNIADNLEYNYFSDQFSKVNYVIS